MNFPGVPTQSAFQAAQSSSQQWVRVVCHISRAVCHMAAAVPLSHGTDTQPHCFAEFGVWSIFVLYSPAVCVMTSFPAALFTEVSLSDQLSHCIPCSLKHWLSTEAQFLRVGGTFEGSQGVPWTDRL